jgi:hypothetical protein
VRNSGASGTTQIEAPLPTAENVESPYTLEAMIFT